MRFDSQTGFSLVELITVLVIAGILALVAAAMFDTSNTELQYGTLMRKIATDVRFAQQLAISAGTGTRVHIDETNNRYYLKWQDGTYIKKPIGGDDFIVQLGTGDFSEVQISGTAFSNGRLDFNTRGVPLNSGSEFTGELNLVTLNNAKKLIIVANTGLLKIEDL